MCLKRLFFSMFLIIYFFVCKIYFDIIIFNIKVLISNKRLFWLYFPWLLPSRKVHIGYYCLWTKYYLIEVDINGGFFQLFGEIGHVIRKAQIMLLVLRVRCFTRYSDNPLTRPYINWTPPFYWKKILFLYGVIEDYAALSSSGENSLMILSATSTSHGAPKISSSFWYSSFSFVLIIWHPLSSVFCTSHVVTVVHWCVYVASSMK